MVRRLLVVLTVGALLFSLGACKKKEEAHAPEMGGAPGPSVVMPPTETQTVVPDAVKGKWTSVKLTIEDKSARKSSDATVKLGEEYAVPGSSIKIKVGDFLPDFRMEGAVITSASNDPNNPAVNVIVTEGGNQIFKGWLYSKFPAIHPFQHEKYGISLKEGLSKG